MAARVPGARALMEEAAVELFAERGPSAVTAAEIAARAGVTERTFFRHFPDKLAAFFGKDADLRVEVATVLAAVPEGTSPLAAAFAALLAHARGFGDDPAMRRRAAVVSAIPELRDRELALGSAWADLLADGLVARGARPDEARADALVGLSLFRAAYESWSAPGAAGRLEDHLRAAIEDLAARLPDAAGTVVDHAASARISHDGGGVRRERGGS